MFSGHPGTERSKAAASSSATEASQDGPGDVEAASFSSEADRNLNWEVDFPSAISRYYKLRLFSITCWLFAASFSFSSMIILAYDKDGVLNTGTFRCKVAIIGAISHFLLSLLMMFEACREMRVKDPERVEDWLSLRVFRSS